RAGEHVPVPGVREVHESARADVRSFMVVDHVAGVALSEALDSGALGDDDLRALGGAVAEVSSCIGAVTIGSRPGFFDDAQLRVPPERPWSEQLPEFAAACMESTPDTRLEPSTRRAWVELCAKHAPSLAEVDEQARLVHSDFNPKNLLVARTDAGWRVTSVLDWEFAYAGCRYTDAGNMLRHAVDYPAAYVDGFRAGYGEGVPAGVSWEYLGAVIDMFALSDLVTRPGAHPVADLAAGRIRSLLDGGLDR
ncbi:MAG TPA: phosphotransferase, partial [Nocardioidaceae bacterium]|nr:phosphotransferase [Nocardioidaceae bacterium]